MKIMKIFKWITVWTASWTMLMSPVALGQEAKRVSLEQMKNVVNELGLNNKITLGEFYKKNINLFPPRIQKEIEPYVKAYQNQLMPSFEVLSSKTTSGEQIPTLRVSQGGELINIQWFGESERMFKFQNTNISEIDVINFNDMFTRIVAGDEKYQKQIESKKTNKVKSSKNSNQYKYPDITKAEWRSMSAYNRANYVINMRQLWLDARAVLNAKKAAKNKNTSQNFFEKNKHFYSLFFEHEAQAAGKGKGKVVVSDERSTNYFTGDTCIVAGYVAKYEKGSNGGEYCSNKVVDQAYANRDNSLYLKAKEFCSSTSQIACNPYVFGTPGGKPTCVTPALSNEEFQKATHWDGPCDSASRLSKEEIEILKDKSKDPGRYEDGNLLSDAERKELFKTEQGKENYKLTEDYLLGILKFRGKVKNNTKSLFEEGVVNDEILEQIRLDKKAFDKEIAEATESCRAESKASKSSRRVHEKNYWQACDQLHRRQLFVTELFAAKCEKDSTFNPDTLKCTCNLVVPNPALTPAPVSPVVVPSVSAPAPAAPRPEAVSPSGPAVATAPPAAVPAPAAPAPVPQVSAPVKPDPADLSKPQVPATIPAEVCPGAKCSVVPGAKPSAASVDSSECEAKFPGATDLNNKCMCSNGKAPKLISKDDASGQEAWECSASDSKKAKSKDDDCGFFCKLWKNIKMPAYLIALGVGAYAIFKALAPKKPALKPPTDICPNGKPAPCAQICTPPLKNQSNGTCGCDGCPPGQTANPTTCFCSSSTTPGTGTLYTCPDSITRVSDLANCPTYACWNGQRYQNPMNCPPQTPTTPSGTGN